MSNTENLRFIKVYVDILHVPCNFSLFRGMINQLRNL
jgi:hypothetical protein